MPVTLTSQEQKRLALVIWRGSGRRLDRASTAAVVGIMEHHWALPPANSYHSWNGKCYDKVRGHLGCHSKTLLAEVRRLRLGGSDEMWLAYWRRDPINADFYGASRLSFIIGIYGQETGLRQWVTGEGWRTNPYDRRRSDEYVKLVERYRRRYFGEIPR